MKATLAIVALAGLVALNSYAQGLVFFSGVENISTNNTSGLNPGNTTIGKTQGAGDYYYALFYTTTATTNPGLVGFNVFDVSSYAWNNASTWTLDTDATANAASTATAGRFASIAPNTDGSTTVDGLAGGATVYFEVVGWSANLGTSISQLEASLVAGLGGYVGESPASGGLVLGNGALTPTPALFAAAAPSLQGFSLGGVDDGIPGIPEPGTLSLAALGGAALLLFRHKR